MESTTNINSATNPPPHLTCARTPDDTSCNMSARKRVRTTYGIGYNGLTLQPGAAVLLKNRTLGGILRVENPTAEPMVLTPSNKLLAKEGLLDDNGDDLPNHLPVFWNCPGADIRVLVPNSDLAPGGARGLSAADYARLSDRSVQWSMRDLCALVPPIPGSEHKRLTMSNYLGYRRSLWGIMRDVRSSVANGPTISIASGAFTVATNAPTACRRVSTDFGEICFTDAEETSAEAKLPAPAADVVAFLEAIGTSGMVSLMQKIVRRQPAWLEHPDSGARFDPREVLDQIVLLAPTMTGIFLPDLGIYVPALQHLLKRMMTCMAEDTEYVQDHMIALGGAALLLARDPSWVPAESHLLRWMTILRGMWQSPRTSAYTTQHSEPAPTAVHADTLPYLIYNELGGMGGDKKMLIWLSAHPRNTLTGKRGAEGDTLDVYIDQHTEARYLWLSPAAWDLSAAFRAYTGANPRRGSPMQPPADLLAAQKETSRMFRGLHAPLPAPNATHRATLPHGTIAARVGQIAIGSKMIVTVDPNSLELVAMPKPSRKASLSQVSTAQKQAAVAAARKKLAAGVRGCTLRAGGAWTVDGVPWEQKRQQEEPIHRGTASVPQAPRAVILAACAFLAGHDDIIRFPRVSRDGSGTASALTGLEKPAYRFLRDLSKVFPHAVWPAGRFGFRTTSMEHRHAVRRQLLGAVPIQWGFPAPTDDRALRPLQAQALEQMMRAHAQEMGVFLWMLVGSGKTLTVLRYLSATRRVHRALWALPASAVASVGHEIARFGWDWRVLVSTPGRKDKYPRATVDRTLRDNCVTLVEHDDVRNLSRDLAPQMVDTAFVYDEVHKAMASKTKRTTYALKLARLSAQLVCLTGTPIVRSTAYPLMEWLKLCVPFRVTSQNFWVAANAMVAQLACTDVKTAREEVQVPVPASVLRHLPPRMGGTAQKPRWREAYHESRACVDQWIVARAMREVYAPRGPAPALPISPTHFSSDHAYAVAVTRAVDPGPEVAAHLSQRVLLVAESKSHGKVLIDALLAAGAPPEDILAVGGKQAPTDAVAHVTAPHLTADEWRAGKPMPKICVAPIQYCEGYTLTWMTVMVTGVYPSNQAKRTQMEGRINRANCERMHRRYITAHAGLTTYMLKHQISAKNLETALKQISNK